MTIVKASVKKKKIPKKIPKKKSRARARAYIFKLRRARRRGLNLNSVAATLNFSIDFFFSFVLFLEMDESYNFTETGLCFDPSFMPLLPKTLWLTFVYLVYIEYFLPEGEVGYEEEPIT